MSILKKRKEIRRLIDLFATEANKFHDISLSTYGVTQNGVEEDRKFHPSNHAIRLWQYYGKISKQSDIDDLLKNLKNSDMKWGLRGAELTHFAVVEGEKCNLFVKMAIRASSIFSEKEREIIKSRIAKEILEAQKNYDSKSMATTNNNGLAIWINYLLYYLSIVNPSCNLSRIEPDPFALSLFALEQLYEDLEVREEDKTIKKLETIKFDVALSFPGEKRDYVEHVANILKDKLGNDKVFYDNYYRSQLAKPNLDVLLQNIYRKQSSLIAVFLCGDYAKKEWCGLEWRAIRDIIKSKEYDKIIFIRFDNEHVDGVLSIDGYINANDNTEESLAKLIHERIQLNKI